MKKIKKFYQFINEKNIKDIKKLKISINDLISTINDNELNLLKTFNLDENLISLKDNINKLYLNNQFNNNIDKKKLSKGVLQDTNDKETLLDDNHILKFFFVYEEHSIELEEPKYIILQYFNRKNNKLSDIKLYENKDSINNFYETLTDKTIEIKKGEKEYIYQTSNSGNNWSLKNPNQVKGEFKDELDYEEVNDILKNKKVKLDK